MSAQLASQELRVTKRFEYGGSVYIIPGGARSAKTPTNERLGASSFPTQTERKRMMIIGGTFKFTNGTMAIFPKKKNHRSVILIPANARVAVLGEDTRNDNFINIRYDDQMLLMEDLRYGIGLGSDASRDPDYHVGVGT